MVSATTVVGGRQSARFACRPPSRLPPSQLPPSRCALRWLVNRSSRADRKAHLRAARYGGLSTVALAPTETPTFALRATVGNLRMNRERRLGNLRMNRERRLGNLRMNRERRL